MNPLKKLAGQTVIYGLSSTVPKFLSYFLVPLHTYIFSNQADYGIVADLYGLVVVLNIILTYGMETAFFWFCKNEKDPDKVYSTSLISLFVTSFLFIGFTALFAQSVSDVLGYPQHPEYVWWFGIIIGVDSLCAIPFVKLRRENKAMKFATLKLLSVGVNVLLNVLFLVVLPAINKHIDLPDFIYSSKIGVGYIFLANVLASLVTLVFLYKDFMIKPIFDYSLWKKMLRYALPLLLAGLAGGINDVVDRQFIKYMLPKGVNALGELGTYYANLKIAVILSVFIQTFRFAAEPFFFNYEKEKDSKTVFADIMKYFVIFCLFIFIGTMANIGWIKYFIQKNYWDGLGIVPMMLIANLFMGIYLNLSIWYKLSGKTMYGAYIIIIGTLITIAINYFFIFDFGYHASAWARLFCYLVMTVICYFLGQKYYPIPYNLKEIGFYGVLFLFILIPIYFLHNTSLFLQLIVNNSFLILAGWYVLYRENLLPVLLKTFKKSA